MHVIANVKKASNSLGLIRPDFDPGPSPTRMRENGAGASEIAPPTRASF